MNLDNRLFFPATQRNKNYIGQVLSRIIRKSGSILEIGSGSGEHAIVFQKRFPNIEWQTSDPESIHRMSIISWIENEKLNNKMPLPLELDVEVTPWQIPSDCKAALQGIVSINMIHIASWNCAKSLFSESGKLLNNGNFLMLYGPFKVGNKHISKSNYLFDQSLKSQNNTWGVRDLEAVCLEAKNHGLFLDEIFEMPANNLSLIFRKYFF